MGLYVLGSFLFVTQQLGQSLELGYRKKELKFGYQLCVYRSGLMGFCLYDCAMVSCSEWLSEGLLISSDVRYLRIVLKEGINSGSGWLNLQSLEKENKRCAELSEEVRSFLLGRKGCRVDQYKQEALQAVNCLCSLRKPFKRAQVGNPQNSHQNMFVPRVLYNPSLSRCS